MNSNINIIGSIADINVIFQFLSDKSLNSSHDYLPKIRTSKSKERIINGIKSAFASYASANHESLLVNVFEHENLNQLKSFALFLQFNYTNKLFFLLNKNLLIKSIRNGKVNLSSKDVIAFISSLKETEIDLKGWSESTIITVARKYISFLKKLGFIKAGRKNELVYFMPTEPMLVFFIYFIKSVDIYITDLFKCEYINFIFVEKIMLIELVKTISLKEFFNVRTNGEELFADLKYEYSEVVDALSKRYQTEV